MTIIVTDRGFAPDDWTGGFQTIEAALAGAGCAGCALDLAPGQEIGGHRALLQAAPMIRIGFDGFTDGRGFTVARMLRLMGYGARLRAGPGLISDQYAMARRAGFDEVEISGALARRQPEPQWRFRAAWRNYDHQSRLRG